jgi:hypothetical protein
MKLQQSVYPLGFSRRKPSGLSRINKGHAVFFFFFLSVHDRDTATKQFHLNRRKGWIG